MSSDGPFCMNSMAKPNPFSSSEFRSISPVCSPFGFVPTMVPSLQWITAPLSKTTSPSVPLSWFITSTSFGILVVSVCCPVPLCSLVTKPGRSSSPRWDLTWSQARQQVGLALAALYLDDSLAGVCSDFASHDSGFHDRLGAGSLEGEFSAKVADCRCVSHRLKVELVEPWFLLCHLCGLRCGGPVCPVCPPLLRGRAVRQTGPFPFLSVGDRVRAFLLRGPVACQTGSWY